MSASPSPSPQPSSPSLANPSSPPQESSQSPSSPQESRFKTSDGLEIFMKKWLVPEGTPLKAKIIFNHGFSEHMDSYNHFFPDFANRGYEIIGYDQRGAGHTSPLKKNFGNTNEYYVFHDLEEIITKEIKDFKGKVFMWGHSMGGAITLNYAVKGEQRERFDGYIANSPLVEVHPKTQGNPILVAVAPFMAKVFPRFKSKVNLNFDYLTDDKERVDQYKKDPLRLGYTTAEQAVGFMDRGKRLLNSVFVGKFVDKPVLVSHGTEDYVNDYNATSKFFELLKVKDKEFKSYPGWPHELTNLTKEKRDKHRDDLLAWFDKHSEVEENEEGPGEAVGVEETVENGEGVEDAKEVPTPIAKEDGKESEVEAPSAVEEAEDPVKEANTEELDVIEEPVKSVETKVEEPPVQSKEVEPVEEVETVKETEPVEEVEPVKETEPVKEAKSEEVIPPTEEVKAESTPIVEAAVEQEVEVPVESETVKDVEVPVESETVKDVVEPVESEDVKDVAEPVETATTETAESTDDKEVDVEEGTGSDSADAESGEATPNSDSAAAKKKKKNKNKNKKNKNKKK